VRADLTYFEAPGGGAVFATSSIAWSGALSHAGYENNISRITGNVLDRFIRGADDG
jgi:N,N-dimethylformamidase